MSGIDINCREDTPLKRLELPLPYFMLDSVSSYSQGVQECATFRALATGADFRAPAAAHHMPGCSPHDKTGTYKLSRIGLRKHCHAKYMNMLTLSITCWQASCWARGFHWAFVQKSTAATCSQCVHVGMHTAYTQQQHGPTLHIHLPYCWAMLAFGKAVPVAVIASNLREAAGKMLRQQKLATLTLAHLQQQHQPCLKGQCCWKKARVGPACLSMPQP